MKKSIFILLSAFYLTACARKSRLDLTKDSHPPIVHKIEMTIAADINSDDSATATWAKIFMEKFEQNFSNYKPNYRTIQKLKNHKDSFTIKVIGGNWCSDTRLEVPRLCRVLYEIDFNPNSIEYYRVAKNKHAIDSDFAQTVTVTKVPMVILYKHGKQIGHFLEHPVKSIEKDLLFFLDRYSRLPSK